VDSLRHRDRYLVCADYDDFVAAEEHAAAVFRDPVEWSRRSLHNIAGASRFSSDETIRQYADEIWGLTPVAVDLGLLESEHER
jgi:starch phosphorylase